MEIIRCPRCCGNVPAGERVLRCEACGLSFRLQIVPPPGSTAVQELDLAKMCTRPEQDADAADSLDLVHSIALPAPVKPRPPQVRLRTALIWYAQYFVGSLLFIVLPLTVFCYKTRHRPPIESLPYAVAMLLLIPILLLLLTVKEQWGNKFPELLNKIAMWTEKEPERHGIRTDEEAQCTAIRADENRSG
jgi:hypothetical protein